MSKPNDPDEQVPTLDLDSEAKNQQRVQEIGESRSMARNQLTQTQPGNQDDEEVLWRMLEAYILELKPELKDTPLEKQYLQNEPLGEITEEAARRVVGPNAQLIDTSVESVTGLLQYVTLGPRQIRLQVGRPGTSRSSGSDTGVVYIAPPRHISRNAFEAANEAFGQLGYKLSHDEIDVHPDPI